MGDFVVPLYLQMLQGLHRQLEKAEASERDRDPGLEQLLRRRLAPDMFPLSDQIGFCCLQAHEIAGRLCEIQWAQPAPIRSIEQAYAAITSACGVLETIDRAGLPGRLQTMVRLTISDDLAFELTGFEYLRDWAIPQFHFHLVAAYAIMRAAGTPLGKADYVGHMFAHRVSSSPAGARALATEGEGG